MMRAFIVAFVALYAIVGAIDFWHLMRSDYPRPRDPWTRTTDGISVIMSAIICAWGAVALWSGTC